MQTVSWTFQLAVRRAKSALDHSSLLNQRSSYYQSRVIKSGPQRIQKQKGKSQWLEPFVENCECSATSPSDPVFGWNNMLAFPLALPCASYHTDESTVLVSFIMTMRKCKDKTNGYNKCFMSETLSPWHPEIPLQGCCHFCYTRLIAPGYCIQIEGIALTHMIWACIKVQCNFLNNHTLMDRTHVCPYGSTVIVLLDHIGYALMLQNTIL